MAKKQKTTPTGNVMECTGYVKNEIKRRCSLKIPIMVFAKGLQNDGDDCHDGLDNAELESCLQNKLQSRMKQHGVKEEADVRWRRMSVHLIKLWLVTSYKQVLLSRGGFN